MGFCFVWHGEKQRFLIDLKAAGCLVCLLLFRPKSHNHPSTESSLLKELFLSHPLQELQSEGPLQVIGPFIRQFIGSNLDLLASPRSRCCGLLLLEATLARLNMLIGRLVST